ncbi:MAG: NAD(P)/FAD-dependent oxidoreductase [Planctomycetota bacterium]|nr:NAD(P)/FAD-dependent oxidoreductase [Planctomycetota bacterium]
MYDAIIIGAGMSGLAAGIRLAHFDQKVCILERHTTIGGLNSFYRIKGRSYDVGLHAVTNYLSSRAAKRGPMIRLLRQLRIQWEELSLSPQIGSTIAFPGVRLDFTNDFELFQSQVARQFPRQKDNLRRLLAELIDYDDLGRVGNEISAREVVGRIIDDPLLVEMIFCPLLYYGGARERDMEWGQFSVMFRSIFLEGFARPLKGVRLILKNHVRKFKSLGGELRLRAGVDRIVARAGRADRVVLEDGSQVEGRRILSSAGWHETMRLCRQPEPEGAPAGRLSFVESISVLDADPKQLGHDRTIVFFNDAETFSYEKPAGLVDLRSGVICSPNNFAYEEPLGEGIVRITALANYDRWSELDAPAYRLEKLRCYDQTVASAVRFMPDFRRHVVDVDMFTPTTIHRFTGHDRGAVYGAPKKRYDGRTHLENLYVCGTDQGMVGIIGSIISGITIANAYCLRQ